MMLASMGLNATTLMKNDRRLALPIAAECGLVSVEPTAGRNASAMIRPDQSDWELADLRRELSRYGLKVCALGAHRNLADEEQLREFLLLIEQAARLNCPVINTGVPDDGHDAAFAEGLLTAATRADALGIAVCLETHGTAHGDGRSLLPLCEVHPSVRICYDTANVLYYSDSVPEDDLPLCLSKVRHVHLKDKLGGKGVWNFPPAGRGIVPFECLLKQLAPFQTVSASVEIEFTPEGTTVEATRRAVAEAVTYLRNLPLYAEMKK